MASGVLLASLLAATQSAGVLDGLPVNAREVGAVGDGIADDSCSLQRSFDRAAELGVQVFLPAGVYRVRRTLRVPRKGLYLYGAGTDTEIRFEGTGSALAVDERHDRFNAVRIRDLAISGTAQAAHGIYFGGDRVGNTYNLVLEGLFVRGFSAATSFGVYLQDSYNARLVGLTVANCGNGIFLGREAIDARVESVWVRDFVRYGVRVEGVTVLSHMSGGIIDAPGSAKGTSPIGISVGAEGSFTAEHVHFEDLAVPWEVERGGSLRVEGCFLSGMRGQPRHAPGARTSIVGTTAPPGYSLASGEGTSVAFNEARVAAYRAVDAGDPEFVASYMEIENTRPAEFHGFRSGASRVGGLIGIRFMDDNTVVRSGAVRVVTNCVRLKGERDWRPSAGDLLVVMRFGDDRCFTEIARNGGSHAPEQVTVDGQELRVGSHLAIVKGSSRVSSVRLPASANAGDILSLVVPAEAFNDRVQVLGVSVPRGATGGVTIARGHFARFLFDGNEWIAE